MVCIPRVAMKGGTFRKAMTQPFTAPKTPITTTTPSRARGQGISGRSGNIRAA